jgi:hypothetical protein
MAEWWLAERTKIAGEKFAPVPLHPPWNLPKVTRDWTHISALRRQRIDAWPMTRRMFWVSLQRYTCWKQVLIEMLSICCGFSLGFLRTLLSTYRLWLWLCKCNNVKQVKLSHYRPAGANGESKIYSSYSFSTSALDGVSGYRALLPGKDPLVPTG